MDLYDQRATQTRRYPPSVSSSPQKDMQPKVKTKASLFFIHMDQTFTRHVSKVIRGVANVDYILVHPHLGPSERLVLRCTNCLIKDLNIQSSKNIE